MNSGPPCWFDKKPSNLEAWLPASRKGRMKFQKQGKSTDYRFRKNAITYHARYFVQFFSFSQLTQHHFRNLAGRYTTGDPKMVWEAETLAEDAQLKKQERLQQKLQNVKKGIFRPAILQVRRKYKFCLPQHLTVHLESCILASQGPQNLSSQTGRTTKPVITKPGITNSFVLIGT